MLSGIFSCLTYVWYSRGLSCNMVTIFMAKLWLLYESGQRRTGYLQKVQNGVVFADKLRSKILITYNIKCLKPSVLYEIFFLVHRTFVKQQKWGVYSIQTTPVRLINDNVNIERPEIGKKNS